MVNRWKEDQKTADRKTFVGWGLMFHWEIKFTLKLVVCTMKKLFSNLHWQNSTLCKYWTGLFLPFTVHGARGLQARKPGNAPHLFHSVSCQRKATWDVAYVLLFLLILLADCSHSSLLISALAYWDNGLGSPSSSFSTPIISRMSSQRMERILSCLL